MTQDWARYNIPPLYAEKWYELREPKHIQMFKDATDFLKGDLKKSSLYIFGRPEIGKTVLATTLLKLFVRWYPYRSAEFISPYDFMTKHDLYEGVERINFMTAMIDRELLVFDDLGSSRNHPWPKEKLAEFFDKRFVNKKLTIFTSNWTDGDLQKEYGDRIYRRTCGEESAFIIDLNSLAQDQS